MSKVTDLSRLESGLTMHEVVYNNDKRLVVGYVFIRYGVKDFRGPDGLPLGPNYKQTKKLLDEATSG